MALLRNWKLGQEDGTTQEYYINGKIKSIRVYKNGKPKEYKEYHENGQLLIHQKYKNGKLMEIVSLNDLNGKKLNKGTLKKGTGTVKTYTAKGIFKWETNYIKGEKQK